MSKDTSTNSIYVAAITWSAMLVIAAFILCYLHCNNMEEKTAECIKAGGHPRDCRDAFSDGSRTR